MSKQETYSKGSVIGINGNLLEIEVFDRVIQNEICYVQMSDIRLMAEVIKVSGTVAFAQVFENASGLRIGDEVEFTAQLLSVSLGPGLLSRNYDGLQNDLNKMDGLLLKRGDYNFPLDKTATWKFKPLLSDGDSVTAGEWLGEVDEHGFAHKIMVPFSFEGEFVVHRIEEEDTYTIDKVIAELTNSEGEKFPVTMVQQWAVKNPLTAYRQKQRPSKILETGIRILDILCPMLVGGTGFIPGPFGCGKTVLQHLLSKQAKVDIVIVAACGERANEVVEIFTEFPKLDDPRTGKKLMERTVIIANTSNMPVAAREASVYTAMTIAEYYRAMGLNVLLLADSTSRWAQALREMSNRMEELPGPDAFPMDLSATVANYYSRAGIVELNNGLLGSITFIGTVSPAGGNLKEPVTESTKKVARCFYALAQNRADSKRYPAIDPLESYSKYLEYPELHESVKQDLSADWLVQVKHCKALLQKGREAYEQINILGDDGVPIGYHIDFWKSELIDFILLQQDAFDKIDCSTSLERQTYMLKLIISLIEKEYKFQKFEEVSVLFKKLINNCKQLNYIEFETDDFEKQVQLINEVISK